MRGKAIKNNLKYPFLEKCKKKKIVSSLVTVPIAVSKHLDQKELEHPALVEMQATMAGKTLEDSSIRQIVTCTHTQEAEIRKSGPSQLTHFLGSTSQRFYSLPNSSTS